MNILRQVREKVKEADEGQRVLMFLWILMIVSASLTLTGVQLLLVHSVLYLVTGIILESIGVFFLALLLALLFMSFRSRGDN